MRKRDSCLVCWRPLPPPATTGRPTVYCGPACRREVEHTARAIRGRVAKLETEIAYYDRVLDTPERTATIATAVGNLTAKQAIANAQAAIGREMDRLHAMTREGTE